MAKILIPTPLRKFTGQQSSVEAPGSTVAESIQSLTQAYPELARQLLDDSGSLRTFVRVYLGDEDIQGLQGEASPVSADAVLSIIPAIAGG